MNNTILLKRTLKKILPTKIIDMIVDIYPQYVLKKDGLSIKKHKLFFDIITNDGRCIRISRKHKVYLSDIINSFEYYFTAVYPIEIDGIRLVDYSTPRFHEISGYDLHPIIFPSFAEPMVTSTQYLEFAKLSNGSIVLDLGAYSGFTSILFDQRVGKDGRVIAVEADEINIKYIKKNFFLYEKITGKKIELLEGAVWENNDGLIFSNEGNMGSSAVSIVGEHRGTISRVSSFTLNEIAGKYNLQNIDFIKCDIEGAESVVFKDSEFFNKYRPRIVIELHMIGASNTFQACVDQLSKFGYICRRFLSMVLLYHY